MATLHPTSDSYATEGYIPEGYLKTAALRRALDRGLAAWRAAPSPTSFALSTDVLAAALRYLQAGYRLDDPHLALILRSALGHGVGVLTALRYQRDAETVAEIVLEALLRAQPPLALMVLWRMQLADDAPGNWQNRLATQLHAELEVVDPWRRTHVVAALYQLETGLPVLEDVTRAEDTAPPGQGIQWRNYLRQRWVVAALLVAGMCVAAGIWLGARNWSDRVGMPALAGIPSGEYRVGDAALGTERPVALDGFELMVHEATNSDYRRCVDAGACRLPAMPDSAQHKNYFFDGRFAQHPVVNVTWRDAADFCEWRGLRLPRADEWEVAAGYSPLTGQRYRYPWGDRFDLRFANFAGSAHGDTQPVGAYRPHGSSAFGVDDLAGNVAEWTDMRGGSAGEIPDNIPDAATYVVKGGSFLDTPDSLQVVYDRFVAAAQTENWLGFRCAR
ncbi:MAG: SUMF1/EgtB/PvdO family nonheme iron enzyme [Litorilinea sp.]